MFCSNITAGIECAKYASCQHVAINYIINIRAVPITLDAQTGKDEMEWI